MIAEWLNSYAPQNQSQTEQALREIMQEIALAGLQRGGFFAKAAFYGGTALRILHGLPRFSEDLDFSLLAPDPQFELGGYLEAVVEEFNALGVKVTLEEKRKLRKSAIDSAFLKADTTWKELVIQDILPQQRVRFSGQLKIKLEVDTDPPLGFETEEKLLLNPYSFYVKTYTLPDLFAGKMHALLFRKWQKRVKGRDWFDFEWYVRKAVPLNLEHLTARARNSGDWTASTAISVRQFHELLEARIDSVSFPAIKDDITRFIPDPQTVEIWNSKYFNDLAEKIIVK